MLRPWQNIQHTYRVIHYTIAGCNTPLSKACAFSFLAQMGFASLYANAFAIAQSLVGLAATGYAIYVLIDVCGTFSYLFCGCAVLLLLAGVMGLLTLRLNAGYLPWIALIVLAAGLNLAVLIALLFFKDDFITAIADAHDVAQRIADNTTIACIFCGVGVAANLVAALVAFALDREAKRAEKQRARRATRTPASTV